MTDLALFDAINSLRAVRRFTSDPVPEAIVAKILRAGSMAGSALNTQPWEFLVLRDPELKQQVKTQIVEGVEGVMDHTVLSPEALVDGVGRPVTAFWAIEIMERVPVYIFVFWNPDKGIIFPDEYRRLPDGRLEEIKPSQLRGASLYPACQNMMLAAHALGIGTLFTHMHQFREPEIKSILHVPPRMFLEAIIFLGYSAEKLGKPRRKPIEGCTHLNYWENAYQPVQ
jgi:nitroreductase